MTIGITGHQRISHPSVWTWVRDQITAALNPHAPDIIGVSSLAIGADQLFAHAIIDCGGRLHVILPFSDYERTFSGKDIESFRILLRKASCVEVIDEKGSDQDHYLSAGKRVVSLSELLIAVWDGEPAKGTGGTADIVGFAKKSGIYCIQIDPKRQITTSNI